ncbi:hypothetical protein [Streptomyces indicus]|uniref:Uncharacterized protein n=1 Tax=Streptomyces indicus TaxID=417292 RepID=A0A1G9AD43_9ACTN|nr:hypothetical protein [Streptomyces indicus]SDK24465.1 hypothetical protein SAMN05421806_105471 [Streptomyces indicus]
MNPMVVGVLTSTYGIALRANMFNDEVWNPTFVEAGVSHPRAGESVVTLARSLEYSSLNYQP